MNSKYIGSGQMAVMFAAFGVLWCICAADYSSCGGMLAECAASAVILGIISISAVHFGEKNDTTIAEGAVKRFGIFGRLISAVYVLYFISGASYYLMKYGTMVSERYFSEGSSLLCIVLLGTVCVYIAHTGTETICRMSTVVLFLFGVTLTMWIVTGWRDVSISQTDMTLSELMTHGADGGFFCSVGAALVCSCIMCGNNGARIRKGIFGGLSAVLGAAAVIIFLVCTILGEYISSSEYPVADAVIYSSRNMTFHPDGIYFLLWTVIGAAVIPLMCACGASAFKSAVPAIRGEKMITAAAAAVSAALCAAMDSELCGILYEQPVMPLLLGGIIPMAVSLKKEGGV